MLSCGSGLIGLRVALCRRGKRVRGKILLWFRGGTAVSGLSGLGFDQNAGEGVGCNALGADYGTGHYEFGKNMEC